MSSVHVAKQGFITKAALPSVSRVRGTTAVADKDTVLLLNGNGTNGAQNNTFIDGSTNNFTITRNGNTTQGTFSPFSQADGNWSNYFDGTGDFLTASFTNLGSSNFTIETWAYIEDVTSRPNYIFLQQQTGTIISNSQLGLGLVSLTSGGLYAFWCSGTTQTGITAANNTLISNKWHHIALVRNGNNFTLYVDGISVGTSTSSVSINNLTTNSPLNRIGQYSQEGNTSNLRGYLSNLRLVIGTAVYTSAFTPPTTPLTAITNTSLLTCQSNRFVDQSTNAFAITRNGDVRVTAFSPFAPTAAYSAATNGASGYFDGTGDYLNVADNANLRFGTSNFTIQSWIYRNVSGATHTIASKGGASTGWVFQVTSTDVLRFTDTTTNIDTTTTIPACQWVHVAVTREGTGTNQLKLFINGTQSATGTVSTNFNQTEQFNIGADRGNANTLNGYLSGFKFTNGTAETITVPTTPPTATTNVAFLCNFTNAGILDSAGMNVLETVGDAKLNTTTKKFGSASMAFDGTGDWLLVPNTPDNQLGTGNFTIEMWVYRSASGTYGLVSKGTSTTGWSVSLNSSNQVVFSYASSSINSTSTVAATTWTHVAVVREGTGTNQTKIYINGVNNGTGTVSTDFNQTNSMYVGADRVGSSAFNGFIDDLRITKGRVRYTANFGPPGELVVYGNQDNIVTNNVYGVYQLA